ISERDGTFHVAPNPEEADPLAFVSRLAGFPVRARAPSRIGARMARPEKAAPRKMQPAPHSLFPIGHEGGAQRLLLDAAAKDVIKDGTTRFDMTNLPLTHFTPKEAGITVDEARRLGYSQDGSGRPLETEDQVLELRPQDILLARSGGEYLVRVAAFIDDLLERLYGLARFYEAKTPRDLLGHLVVTLAPHTSGGVLA